jgi:hypothetical protein
MRVGGPIWRRSRVSAGSWGPQPQWSMTQLLPEHKGNNADALKARLKQRLIEGRGPAGDWLHPVRGH